VIIVRCSAAPTTTTPAKLNETAATVMRILARAVTACTQIKAGQAPMTGSKPARFTFRGILSQMLTWLVILTPRGGYLG
jgi:hypothetical protein